MGEPAGIGGEIAVKAWDHAHRHDAFPVFVMIDDVQHLEACAGRLGIDVPIRPVSDGAEATAVFPEALPVLPLDLAAAPVPGRPAPENAPCVIRAIDRAVALVQGDGAAALVTNPIQKATLYKAGFAHPGHTEYLAQLAGSGAHPAMMLVASGLRVVPVTIHIPLAQVAGSLSADLIETTGRTVAAALQTDFGIDRPRLVVAGLNPHAGEDGSLGREEIDIIAPAVARLRAAGLAAEGPFPADTLFHAHARSGFDAVMCMYHDQALIPLKTIDFWGGVNVTLGLPFVRTSPDHGTALDLAGTGKANPDSLIRAIETAADLARNRLAHGRRSDP